MAKAAKSKGGAPAQSAAIPMDLLTAAVQALNTGTPAYASREALAPLLAHPSGALVEINENMKDANGNVAYRATAAGVTVAQSGDAASNPPNSGASEGAPARTFQFDDAVPIPTARRGGKGQNTYGFEQMAIGQSFFIPKTADNPNPSKRIASTVSAASKRLAPKQFIVRSVDETAQGRGPGARVWRDADAVPAPAPQQGQGAPQGAQAGA